MGADDRPVTIDRNRDSKEVRLRRVYGCDFGFLNEGVDYEAITNVAQLIFDSRNALKGEGGDKVVTL